MLPAGIHIALADTSAPPRALLTTIAAVNARLLAGWRDAAWRHCNPLSGQRFAGTLPSADWLIIAPGAAGPHPLPGDLLLQPDGEVHNTLPLYVGDRVIATSLRMSGTSSSVDNVVTTRLIRYGAGLPGVDDVLQDLPDAEILVEATVTIPRRLGATPVPIDILIDVTAALGAPVTVRDWDLIRVVTTATGVAPGNQSELYFHALAALVDHPV